jgi:hypothetical protein
VSPSQIVQYAKSVVREREKLHKKVKKLVSTSSGCIDKVKLEKLVELDNSGLPRIKSLSKLVSSEPMSGDTSVWSHSIASVNSPAHTVDSESQNSTSLPPTTPLPPPSTMTRELPVEANEAGSSVESNHTASTDETLTATEREDEDILTTRTNIYEEKCPSITAELLSSATAAAAAVSSPVEKSIEKDKQKQKHKSTSSSGSAGSNSSLSKPSSKSIIAQVYSAKIGKNFKIPKQSANENKHEHHRHHANGYSSSSHCRISSHAADSAGSSSSSFSRKSSPDSESYSNTYYSPKSNHQYNGQYVNGSSTSMRCSGSRGVTPPSSSSTSMQRNAPSTFLMQQ